MQKILTAEQIHNGDNFTIENEPIASVELMNRAATKCCEWILDNSEFCNNVFLIFCGTGNNGGDGVAIARILYENGRDVKVFISPETEKFSEDLKYQIERFPKSIDIYTFTEFDNNNVKDNCVFIDAIFGTGLKRNVTGIYADIIYKINELKNSVISIDLPSGLFADSAPKKGNKSIVKSDFLLTLGFYKNIIFFPESNDFIDKIFLLDIGISEQFIKQVTTKNFVLEPTDYLSIYKPRRKFGHKGTYGHSLCIGGSVGKFGSVLMAGKSSLKAGSGLASVLSPANITNYYYLYSPELMFVNNNSVNFLSELPELSQFQAIGVGMGLGVNEKTKNVLLKLIHDKNAKIVLDADAINILGENREMLDMLYPNICLTPHLKEFERITEPARDSFHRIEILRNFCTKYKLHVLLKGAYTVVCTPDGDCFFNTTGNPGMATAGAGDILTGIITGLLAQGYAIKDACTLGTFLHGLSADIAAEHTAYEAIVASDIIENLGLAFKRLYHK